MKKWIAAGLTIATALNLWAQAPEMFRYQGRLVDGTNLVNAALPMSFKLYDALSGGNLVYEDSSTVLVVDGLYSTTIGDNTTFGSLTNAMTNAAVYLELTINGETLSPRERLVSVPYALNPGSSTLNITQEALDARYVLLTGSNITSLAAFRESIGAAYTGNTVTTTGSNIGTNAAAFRAAIGAANYSEVTGLLPSTNGTAMNLTARGSLLIEDWVVRTNVTITSTDLSGTIYTGTYYYASTSGIGGLILTNSGSAAMLRYKLGTWCLTTNIAPSLATSTYWQTNFLGFSSLTNTNCTVVATSNSISITMTNTPYYWTTNATAKYNGVTLATTNDTAVAVSNGLKSIYTSSSYFDPLTERLRRQATTSKVVYVTFVNDDESTNAALDTLFSSLGVPYCPAVIVANETPTSLSACKTNQDLYGFEYLSHTWSHNVFNSMNASQAEYQCSMSYSNMVNAGLKVESLIYPGGYWPTTNNVSAVLKYYKSGSHASGSGLNAPPIDSYLLSRRPIDNYTLAQMQAGVSNAIANTSTILWQIDYFHSYMYETNQAYYTTLSNYVAWIKTQPDVQIVTYSTALKTAGYLFEIGSSIVASNHYGISMTGVEVKPSINANANPYYGVGTLYADGKDVFYLPASGVETQKLTHTGATTNIVIGSGTLYFYNGILTNSTGF